MPSELASAYLTLIPTLKGAQSKIESELGGIDVSGSGKKTGGGWVAGLVGGAAAALTTSALSAVTGSLDAAVSRVDTLNNFPNIMQNLGITEGASEAINGISKSLEGLPTTLDAAASGVTNFVSKNGDLDRSADMFLAVNNAILAGGKSADIQSTALEQLTQSYSKGKMDMQEWRALQTAMPAQLNQIASAMGMTSDALGEGLRDGSVSMDAFMDKVVELNETGTGGFASLEEQARSATGGIANSLSLMKTAVTRNIANVMDAIGSSNISAVTSMISGGIDAIGKAVVGLVQHFSPAIESIMEFMNGTATLQDAIWGVTHTISEMLVLGLENLATNMLPKGMEIIMGVVDGISAALPEVIGIVSKLIPLLAETVVSALPQMMSAASTLFTGLIDGLTQAIPALLTALAQVIPQLVQTLVGALPTLIQGALQLFMGIVQGISEAVPVIITALVEALPLIVDSLVSALPQIITGAIELFLGIVTGLIQALPQIITAVIGAIPQIAQTLIAAVPQILQAAMTLFMAIVDAVPQILGSLVNALGSLVKSGIDAIGGFVSDMAQAGLNLIMGFIDGIKNAASAVIDAISGVVGDAIEGAKNLLGIASPSKVFAEIGRFTGLGLAEGITSTTSAVNKAMEGVLSSAVSTAEKELPAIAMSATISRQVSQYRTPSVSSAQLRPADVSTLVDVMNRGFETLAKKDSSMYLDGKRLVGATAGMYDQAFGRAITVSEGGF